MNKKCFAPSIMCVDLANLNIELAKLEEAGADLIHIDIMDGYFVPNISLSKNDINAIVKNTKVAYDFHLMVEKPLTYLKYLEDFKPEIIYFHIESSDDPLKVVEKIKSIGARVGVAINPETEFSQLEPINELVDDLLIMTVHPGFSGSTYLVEMDDKILQIKEAIKIQNLDIRMHIDGAISEQKIRQHAANGVEGFVLGTKTLFFKDETYSQILNRIKNY